MVTDDERREVAARLRHAWTKVPDRDTVRHQLRVLLKVYEEVGLDGGESDAIDLFDRLADLIEPSCDRDALLALADRMEHMAGMGALLAAHGLAMAAASIRESCGEVES